jgi:pimeloyl-ACP methyl ester carboxylesterase
MGEVTATAAKGKFCFARIEDDQGNSAEILIRPGGTTLTEIAIGSRLRVTLSRNEIGAIGASLANRWVLGKIMGGGYADPRKLPADLLAEFHETGHRPNYHYVERKVLSGWRSWDKARERYSGVSAPVTLIYGDKDSSRIPERGRTKAALRNARLFTIRDTGHFASVENPQEVASIILA